jgi:hypothetical protein
MPTPEQKELWRKEKEQLLRDKEAQPREVRRRAVDLKFGGVKRKPGPRTSGNIPAAPPDELLRKNLGI